MHVFFNAVRAVKKTGLSAGQRCGPVFTSSFSSEVSHSAAKGPSAWAAAEPPRHWLRQAVHLARLSEGGEGLGDGSGRRGAGLGGAFGAGETSRWRNLADHAAGCVLVNRASRHKDGKGPPRDVVSCGGVGLDCETDIFREMFICNSTL